MTEPIAFQPQGHLLTERSSLTIHLDKLSYPLPKPCHYPVSPFHFPRGSIP